MTEPTVDTVIINKEDLEVVVDFLESIPTLHFYLDVNEVLERFQMLLNAEEEGG